MFNLFPRRRPTITYDIVPSAEGWRVSVNDVPGPPYAVEADAISDTLFTAERLRATGERVRVRLLELDGPHRVWRALEPGDTAARRVSLVR
jgi:hypothetical protein